MQTHCRWIWLVAAIVLTGVGLSAQASRFIKPQRFERPTEADEQGLQQWVKWPETKCPSCKGSGKLKCATCERYPDEAKICPDCGRKEKRQADCHMCVGKGTIADPLDQALCPGCRGAGYIICGSCPGSGILKLGDGAKRWSNCIGCRGAGFFKCMLCKGKRVAPMAKLKPSLREADSEQLAKALKATDATLQALAAFEPVGKKTRKEVKALNAALKKGVKAFPVFKQSPKLIKQLMKMTYAGSNYEGQQEREVRSMSLIKANHEYYLQHQKRMLELAKKRAELNEKIAAGK